MKTKVSRGRTVRPYWHTIGLCRIAWIKMITTENSMKHLFFFTSILLCFSGCIRSFVPDIGKHSELMVVDGNIHNGPGPYVVKLSKSSKTQEISKFIPYTECSVSITDNAGNSVQLKEKQPGVYQSDSASFRGIPGRTYQLHIATKTGEQYESTPELLKKGLQIQSVYGELKHKDDPQKFWGRDGYQFYLDAEAPPTTDNYLLWRMQATYKFRADFPIICYYDNGVHPVKNADTLRTCYRTSDILDFYLLNTNELKQTQVNRIPLNYEDNYTKALSIRYSLKVSQFTITETAYKYWSAIKKMRDEGGELYTQQPYQVPNNLKNLSDPNRPVLGYFMVAGLAEKRIFIKPAPLIIREEKCEIGEPQFFALKWFKDTPAVWPVFYADNSGSAYYLPPECVDCRENGTLDKPSFWIE